MKKCRSLLVYLLAGAVIVLCGLLAVVLVSAAFALCEWLWHAFHPAVGIGVGVVLAVLAAAGALWVNDVVRDRAKAIAAQHEEED